MLKKFPMIMLIIIYIGLNSSIAATSTKTETSAPADNVYLEAKPNIVVSFRHPEFVVKLKSNPATGYGWFLREYDINLIEPKGHSFQPSAGKNLIGAPGYELWTFRVKPAAFTVPHQTIIRLIYARPWQGNEGASQVVFKVTTEGK